MKLEERVIAGEFDNEVALPPYRHNYTDSDKWDANIKLYRDEEHRLSALFKTEALKEFGLETHPSRDLIYDIALKMHDNEHEPYPELLVLDALVRLSELVKEVQRDTLEAK